MLDLGIGSGVQAMRAANRVERVVGADLNPRALAFARFNAALNGVSNLELRLGSWLEPVQGDRFDLVLANLPFIIGPDFDLLYRNPGDTEGETFGALLKALPDVLTDGGIAQAFCHWPIRSGQTWVDPLREWTEGIDHRAVFVRIIVDDIAQYSARSVRMKDNDHELYRETVGRWLRHFTAIGIEAMGFGMVAIQRRPGPVRRLGVAALSDHRGDAAGAHVRRLLEAADRTAVLEDERTALAQRVSLLDGHELGTTAVYHEGTYAMGERVLIMDPKGLLGLSVQVPAGVVEVLRACGPERTLGEVVQDAAQRSGVNRDTIAQASLAAVRELAAKALLTVHT
jgi:methylase of polypeptide subunit release factors